MYQSSQCVTNGEEVTQFSYEREKVNLCSHFMGESYKLSSCRIEMKCCPNNYCAWYVDVMVNHNNHYYNVFVNICTDLYGT